MEAGAMTWDDISPELLASIREPFAEEPESDIIPEPEDMRRRREFLAALAARRRSQVLPMAPDEPGGRSVSQGGRLRLFPVVISGIAAALLIGIIGLLARQQAITSRQLARSQADLERFRDQNAKIAVALDARESEHAELRRQDAGNDVLRVRLLDIGKQLTLSQTELERLRQQNAEIAIALGARESENAELRRQSADNLVLRASLLDIAKQLARSGALLLERLALHDPQEALLRDALKDVLRDALKDDADRGRQAQQLRDAFSKLQQISKQLERMGSKPGWPPTAFSLMGRRSAKPGQPAGAVDFLAGFRRDHNGEYVGYFIQSGKPYIQIFGPLDKDAIFTPFAARGQIMDDKTITFRVMGVHVAGSELTNPDRHDAESPAALATLQIDIGAATFTGTIGKESVSGNITR
jgi:hypothetical protein